MDFGQKHIEERPFKYSLPRVRKDETVGGMERLEIQCSSIIVINQILTHNISKGVRIQRLHYQ